MITNLNHITLAVSDLDKSLHFYTKTLGLTGHVRWDGGAYLSAGPLWLCLSVDDTCPKTDYTHIAFDVSADDFASYCSQLRQAGVEEWKLNRSEGKSLYLLDPDGHKLEIHVGDLGSRLQSLKSEPYPGLEWL